MQVFGRSKSTQEAESVSGGSAGATRPDSTGPVKEGGKGRATPKRSEAERGRRRAVTAPTNRKEALKLTRARQREERLKASQALRAGDERNLPSRDRGPVRRYVRDTIDGRRSVGEFFLPLALVVLLLITVGNLVGSPALGSAGNVLWLMLVALVAVDSVVLVVRLRRGLARTFPDSPTKGSASYGLMRSLQIRRFRLPPPRVKPGRPGSGS